MQSLFDATTDRLLRAGIAPRHVRRYLAELQDHLDDFASAERDQGLTWEDAEARALTMLGDADMLADAMIAQGRKFRSFTSRVPWAVFVVFPPFALLTFFMAMGIVLAFAGWFGIPGFYFDTSGALFTPPDWYVRLGVDLSWFANFLLPVLASSLVAWIAWRQRMPIKWPLIGILLIAAMGAGLTTYPDFPESVAGRDWTIALIIISDVQQILLRIAIALVPLAALLFSHAEVRPRRNYSATS